MVYKCGIRKNTSPTDMCTFTSIRLLNVSCEALGKKCKLSWYLSYLRNVANYPVLSQALAKNSINMMGLHSKHSTVQEYLTWEQGHKNVHCTGGSNTEELATPNYSTVGKW